MHTVDILPDGVVVEVADAEPHQQLVPRAHDVRVVHASHQLLQELELVLANYGILLFTSKTSK